MISARCVATLGSANRYSATSDARASGDHPVSVEAVMGLFSKDIESLDDLFVDTSMDIADHID